MSKLFRFCTCSRAVLAAMSVLPAAAAAQSSPSHFTSGLRYDFGGHETGTIYPDPDGAGPLHYRAIRRTYDDAGRLIRIETGELAAWQSEAIDPVNWTSFTVSDQTDTAYDSVDHKVLVSRSSGGAAYAVTQYSYDPIGRLLCTAVRMNPATFVNLPDACIQSAAGSAGPDRITMNVYDVADQLVQVRRAVGTSIEQAYATYSFTPNGKQQYVVDANGNRAQLTYDGFDRQTGWILPAVAATTGFNPSTPATAMATAGATDPSNYEAYGYDGNDNRTSLRKRDGGTILFQFDGLNRMTRKIVPASASGAPGYSVYFGYDVRGQELYARFGSDTGPGISNVYDGLGRLTASTTTMDGTARTISHGRDLDGNTTALTATSGYVMAFAYDEVDRLATARDGNGELLVSISYDAAGRRLAAGLGSGAAGSSVSYGYDPIGRLASLGHDLAGTSGDQTSTFAYNPASQIITRTMTNDAYASNTAYNVARTYTANGLNQYSAAGPAAFQYDANGNLTWDGSTSFVYDAENRLVSASGAKTANLSYDPHGRLWQVSGGASGTTRFEYDGNRLLQEWDGSGNLLRLYVHGTGDDEPLIWFESAGGPVRRYYHTDHHGSVIALADDAGNPIAMNAYDAWGIPNAANGGRLGYTGQAWLFDLGMWYYKARIYSPTLGRFMQTDPVGYKDQVNLYAYVGNDPFNQRDPSGEFAPGDPFPSAAAAADDAIRYINPRSIAENKEYGGYIYNVGDKFYASQPTTTGSGTQIPHSVPKTADGDYHTHGDYSKVDAAGNLVRTTASQDQFNSDHFSTGPTTPNDVANSKLLMLATGNGAYRSYLGTPSGIAKEYDPFSNVEKVLIVIPPPPPSVFPEGTGAGDAVP